MCRWDEEGKGRWSKVVWDGYILAAPGLTASHFQEEREGAILFMPKAHAGLRTEALPRPPEYVLLKALRDVSAA
jgi:hypothetical protein